MPAGRVGRGRLLPVRRYAGSSRGLDQATLSGPRTPDRDRGHHTRCPHSPPGDPAPPNPPGDPAPPNPPTAPQPPAPITHTPSTRAVIPEAPRSCPRPRREAWGGMNCAGPRWVQARTGCRSDSSAVDPLQLGVDDGLDGLDLGGGVGAAADDPVECVGVRRTGLRRPEDRRLGVAVLVDELDRVGGRAGLELVRLRGQALAGRDVETVRLREVELVVGLVDPQPLDELLPRRRSSTWRSHTNRRRRPEHSACRWSRSGSARGVRRSRRGTPSGWPAASTGR